MVNYKIILFKVFFYKLKIDMEFYKNLEYIRTKYYNIQQQSIYDDWVIYYNEDLTILYTIFSKYYYLPYDQFVKLFYDTQ